VAAAAAAFTAQHPASTQARKHASDGADLDADGVSASVYGALINRKVNACPMAVRVAWHASGTYDDETGDGGSDGATMRYEPERSDPANAGLFIIHDLLLRVKVAYGNVLSFADLWTLAGCKAVEWMGGPRIDFRFGRSDAQREADTTVPPNGLLPDASKGAAHLREVFGRMGFDDRDIVALSGAHTTGRCHKVRSGYDGPWTRSPLRFDNEYFRNLMDLEWKVREWDGPLQYTDVATETLTMLPTDMALRTDAKFAPIAREYADDQAAFFRDFASAFGRLVSKGCPEQCQPAAAPLKACARSKASAEMRELAMHGSLEHIKKVVSDAGGPAAVDVNSYDTDSGRTAMHKAAFWGHAHVIEYLTATCMAKVSPVDFAGDTPLHDAARFGHAAIVRKLLAVGCDCGVKNKQGKDALEIARDQGKDEIVEILTDHMRNELAVCAKARRDSFLLGGAPATIRKLA